LAATQASLVDKTRLAFHTCKRVHAVRRAGVLGSRRSEIFPGVTCKLDLENATLVRVQEVLAFRDSMSM